VILKRNPKNAGGVKRKELFLEVKVFIFLTEKGDMTHSWSTLMTPAAHCKNNRLFPKKSKVAACPSHFQGRS